MNNYVNIKDLIKLNRRLRDGGVDFFIILRKSALLLLDCQFSDICTLTTDVDAGGKGILVHAHTLKVVVLDGSIVVGINVGNTGALGVEKLEHGHVLHGTLVGFLQAGVVEGLEGIAVAAHAHGGVLAGAHSVINETLSLSLIGDFTPSGDKEVTSGVFEGLVEDKVDFFVFHVVEFNGVVDGGIGRRGVEGHPHILLGLGLLLKFNGISVLDVDGEVGLNFNKGAFVAILEHDLGDGTVVVGKLSEVLGIVDHLDAAPLGVPLEGSFFPPGTGTLADLGLAGIVKVAYGESERLAVLSKSGSSRNGGKRYTENKFFHSGISEC